MSQPKTQPNLSQASTLAHSQPSSSHSPPPPPYTAPNTSTSSLHRPATYLTRAVRCASFPLRGVWYFCSRRWLWPLFVGRLVPLSIISFLVYFVLFAVAFLPQYAFLAIFHGWGSWVNAIVLVLAEGMIIIQGLFEGFFVDECRVNVFDATLVDKNHASLVSPHRVVHPPESGSPLARLGPPTSPAVFTPWSLTQLAELVFFLPLNLIPVVGTPAFILITGSRLGKLAHHRWFALRGLSKREAKSEVRGREWEYLWFGTVGMVFELVPVLSMFFLLTTAAGAALWAAREEDDKIIARGDVVGGGRAGVDALPEEYHDDPV